jgi:hypothetical protein
MPVPPIPSIDIAKPRYPFSALPVPLHDSIRTCEKSLGGRTSTVKSTVFSNSAGVEKSGFVASKAGRTEILADTGIEYSPWVALGEILICKSEPTDPLENPNILGGLKFNPTASVFSFGENETSKGKLLLE